MAAIPGNYEFVYLLLRQSAYWWGRTAEIRDLIFESFQVIGLEPCKLIGPKVATIDEVSPVAVKSELLCTYINQAPRLETLFFLCDSIITLRVFGCFVMPILLVYTEGCSGIYPALIPRLPQLIVHISISSRVFVWTSFTYTTDYSTDLL